MNGLFNELINGLIILTMLSTVVGYWHSKILIIIQLNIKQ